MKKKALLLVIVFVSLLCLFIHANAEDIDLKSMTDEELRELIDNATIELNSRTASSSQSISLKDGGFVFEYNGISVVFDPGYTVIRDLYMSAAHRGKADILVVKGYVSNQSNMTIDIYPTDGMINGWSIGTMGGAWSIPPGEKQKAEFRFALVDANISTAEEIESFETGFMIYEPDSLETYYITERVKLVV